MRRASQLTSSASFVSKAIQFVGTVERPHIIYAFAVLYERDPSIAGKIGILEFES